MAKDEYKAVEVGGLAVRIYPERAADWHTFGIIRRVGDMTQFEQLDAMFEIIAHCTDQTEQSIVSHLGGETAKADEVIALAIEIIQAATGKN